MTNKKVLLTSLFLFLLVQFMCANSKEYVFPPMEKSETMEQKNNPAKYAPLPYSNKRSEYPPLTHEKTDSGYRPITKENNASEYLPLAQEEQDSATYFKHPGYQFPPSESDNSDVNVFSNQPMFPPREQQKSRPAYAYDAKRNVMPYEATRSYSESYNNPQRRQSYQPRNKANGYRKDYANHYGTSNGNDYGNDYGYPSYRNKRQINDTGMGNFYKPYGSVPFQNMNPGFNDHGRSMWNPFTRNINTMPFNNSSMDYRNLSMPGFFSR